MEDQVDIIFVWNLMKNWRSRGNQALKLHS